MAQLIIIDTDPGVDDALALFFALKDPSLKTLLITTNGGNSNIRRTTHNALHLMELFKANIPISEGASRPLVGKPEYAEEIQGEGGLGGYSYDVTSLKHKPIKLKAEDAIYKTLKDNAPAKVTLLCIAPLTNIALLLQKYPDSKNMIEKIVLMGGFKDKLYGKPYKEFNIGYDPAAAEIVLGSGIELVMMPMDLGHFAFFEPKEIEKIKAVNETGRVFAKMFENYLDTHVGKMGAATHDLCAVFYLTHPELIKTENARISIKYYKNECGTKQSMGEHYSGGMNDNKNESDINCEDIGYIDVDYASKTPNATVCVDIEVAKFKHIFMETLKKEG